MNRIFLFAFLTTVLVFAGVVEPFKQFTQADFNDYEKPGQKWSTANMFTLNVSRGSDVWLSNYIRSWYEPVTDLHGNVYDMGANERYGYIFAKDLTSATLENGSYADKIHWSNGKTTDITYFLDSDPKYTNTATGYFLDYFEDDAEIYLVMTTIPEDGVETVDIYQFVQDANNETLMYSRQHNTVDLAGNVRVNFGIDNGEYGDGVGIGREFVAVYNDTAFLYHTTPAGGPLPGLLVVGLLSAGTVFGASRLKKKTL